MSNCEHSDLIYAFCVACELAKREKLIVELQSQLSQVQGELQHTTAVAMSAEARTVKLEAERDSLKAENEILRQAFDDGTHKA